MRYTSSTADIQPTAPITTVFSHLAAFAGRTELTVPENMDKIMEKKGKFCTKSIYSPSFFSLAEISSRSSVWYLRYRRMVRDSISAVTETDTTMPVSTSPLGTGLI